MSVIREIGGYFGLEAFSGEEYHKGLIGVNSGRNALLYVLKVRGVQKLYIPRFLCDSVSELCKREVVEYEEYSIDKNFLPVFTKTLGKDEYLYVVNFYGQISNEILCELHKQHKNIIFDNVQAFFQKPVTGIDTVYSCRKFFGVPDGGYVYTEKRLEEELLADISKDRMKHILGRFEETGTKYYGDFQANDELFYDMPLREMSALTRNILRGVDYELVRQRRNENYAVLENALASMNGLKLKTPNGPYCYPFYCKNGMDIKKQLAAQKIYVATLWPNVLELGGTLEKDYAENILPIPCDQRYGAEEMKYIASTILKIVSQET